jgi:hypothetical protein
MPSRGREGAVLDHRSVDITTNPVSKRPVLNRKPPHVVTDLAESGAGDEVIRDMAGHVSKECSSITVTFARWPNATRWTRCPVSKSRAELTPMDSNSEGVLQDPPQVSSVADAARNLLIYLAPQVGFEPTTLRLTAECSTVELLRSNVKDGCFHITPSFTYLVTAAGRGWFESEHEPAKQRQALQMLRR